MTEFLLLDLPLALITWGIFVILAFWDPDRKYTLVNEPPGDLPSDPPMISVLIPARNEAKNIGHCLESLRSQSYPRFEVIVIDDGSTDGTGDVVRSVAKIDTRFRLVQGKEPPPGWLGKPNALAVGTGEAKGTWFIFLDADTRLSENALSQTLAYALREGADMVNLFPYFASEGVWEKAIQPFMTSLLFITGSLSVVNRPRFRSSTFALGQFILFKREVYEKIGGHAAVRDSFVEDLRLAKLAKGAGYVTRSLRGMDLIRTRMYRGFRDIFSGWSRTSYPGLNSSMVLAVGGLFFLLTLCVLPLCAAVGFGLKGFPGTWSPDEQRVLAYSSATYLAGLIPTIHIRRRFNQFPEYAVFYPVAAAVVCGIMLYSIWRHVIARNPGWKGRAYRPSAS